MLEKKEKGQWKNSHKDGTASGISVSVVERRLVRIDVVSPVFGENPGWVFYFECKDRKDCEDRVNEIDNLIDFVLKIERHA